MESNCRPLYDKRLVQHFVENILEISKPDELKVAVNKITSAELKLPNTKNKTTLKHDSFRDPNYVDEKSRIQLRNQIFEELISTERPEDDDKITIGYGGALPRGTEVKSENQAYIIIGPPASGKSSISNKVSDHYGAIILDSDFAKRKFPEYSEDYGASLVHEESTAIVFGEQDVTEYNMLEYCCAVGHNIVIPRIGHNVAPILKLTDKLKEYNYEVHITLISLDRKKATQRAYYRFLETGRYVPLTLIFDGYANDPILSYYRLKDKTCFKSYGKISTDVKKGHSPILVEGSEGNPAKLFE